MLLQDFKTRATNYKQKISQLQVDLALYDIVNVSFTHVYDKTLKTYTIARVWEVSIVW